MKTNDLTRRNFLFGTVAAAAAGTALTIVGKDVQLFQPTVDEIVAINRITPMNQPQGRMFYGHMPQFEPIGPGDSLFNKHGKEVAVVREMSVEHEQEDITAFGDTSSRYVRGGVMEVRLNVMYVGGPITIIKS